MTIESDDRDELHVRRARMIDEFRQAQMRRRATVSRDADAPLEECGTNAAGDPPLHCDGVVITVR